MSDHAELELFRDRVTCAAVLEQFGEGWQLDARQSTRQALKYRAGPGRILVINHHGRGWWDATGSAKGDVFSLVRFLEPGLNFGEVRKVLRRLVGVTPSYPAIVRTQERKEADVPPALRWQARPRLRRGDRAWHYLADVRCLPADLLAHAGAADVVRNGAYDSAWFAHRRDGAVTHVEVRGPSYKGSLRGGSKTLFRFSWTAACPTRLAVLEAPIDALSLAALEGRRADTLYVATGGGMGPGTITAIDNETAALASRGGTVAIGTDANRAGERYADVLAKIAERHRAPHERLRPPFGEDWNDVLRG